MHARYWLPPIACYAAISLLSHWGGAVGISLPDYGDKAVHFGEYFVFGLLLARAVMWEKYFFAIERHWRGIAVVIVLLAPALDELHQRFVPGRAMEAADWVADVAGAACGVFLSRKFYRHRFRKT